MSIYKLADCTLAMTGDITATYKYNILLMPAIFPGQSAEKYEIPTLAVGTPWGASVTLTECPPGPPFPAAHNPAGVIATANNGAGATASNQVDNGGYVAPLASPYVLNCNGSYSFSVECELFVEFLGGGGYNGYDGPAPETIRIFVKTKVGGTSSASITSGASCTATGTISTAVEITDWKGGISMDCAVLGGTNQVADATFSIDRDFYGAQCGAFSATMDGGKLTLDVGGSAVTVHARSDDADARESYGFNTAAPDRPFNLEGVVRSMGEAYVNSLDLTVTRHDGTPETITATGGAFSTSYTQKRYENGGQFLKVGVLYPQPGLTVDEWCPITLAVNATGTTNALDALGEDTRDTRPLFRTWFWDAFTIQQITLVTVDDGTDVTPGPGSYAGVWQDAGTGATVVVGTAGGKITAEVTTGSDGDPAELERVFTPHDGGFMGYRYLKIYCTNIGSGGSQNATPNTVKIKTASGTKDWERDASGNDLMSNTGSGTFWLLDLRSPTSETTDVDGQDSKWPLVTSDGPYWGVTGVENIRITGLVKTTPTTTWQVDKIELINDPDVTTDHAQISFMEGFDDFIQEKPAEVTGGTTTTTFVQRFVHGDNGGRISLEEPDTRKTVVSTGGGDVITYAPVRIEDFVNTINNVGQNYALVPDPNCPGWVAVPSVALGATDPSGSGGPFADWLNCNRPMSYVAGSGASFHGSAWHYWQDKDVKTAALTVQAQVLVDTIQDWPPYLFGDIFNIAGGTVPGPLEVRAAYFVRGQNHGIVLDPNCLPIDAEPVTLTDLSDASSSGSGTTSASGEYTTGTPYGRSVHNQRTKVQTKQFDREYRKKRHSTAFKITEAGTGVTYDVSYHQRHVHGYLQDDTIRIGLASDVLATVWDDVDTELEGTKPSARTFRRHKEQRLYLTYIDTDDALQFAYSKDGGRTWAYTDTVIDAAENHCFTILPDGRCIIYWQQDDGTIHGKMYDAVMNMRVDDFTVVGGGVDSLKIACRDHTDGGGVLNIHLMYWTGGALAHQVSSDGQNFSGLTPITDEGTDHCFTVMQDGRVAAYWRKDDNSIHGKIFGAQDELLVDDFVAVASDVEDKGMDCRDYVSGAGVQYVHLEFWSMGSLVDLNAKDGQNFS